MSNDLKFERFERLIIKDYSDDKNFVKIKTALLFTRQKMLKHKAFHNASALDQYNMCVTIGVIVIDSNLFTLNEIRDVGKKIEPNLSSNKQLNHKNMLNKFS
jgi:hypothetical protein